jgi:hypothetical protein
LLQGAVFGAESPVLLARLRATLAEVEADPTHPWYAELQQSPRPEPSAPRP